MSKSRDQDSNDVVRRRNPSLAGETGWVSCRPLGAVFEAVEREGRDTAELLVGVMAEREHLLDRKKWVSWDDFRTVIDNATRDWSEEQVLEFGKGLVHTRSQVVFALIAKHLFSVSDFYRAVFSPKAGFGPVMFPNFRSTFAQVGPTSFEATLELDEAYEPCPNFFLVTKGNVTSIPEVLGSPPARVEMESSDRFARYEIEAEDRRGPLARLRNRVSLLFRGKDMAAELQAAHASLRSRYDAVYDALREREETELALRESEERNRMLVESVGDAFFVLDEENRIVDVNERACKSLGRARDEVLGASLVELGADWAADRLQPPAEGERKRVAAIFEGVQRREDGETVPVEVRGTWVTAADGSRRFYGLAHDLTERHRAEDERERHAAQLRRSQKLEALGTLAGGIMHDFNNLLQAIGGYSELAYESCEEGSVVREYLDHVLRACAHGKQISKQILTFSSMTDPDRRPLDIATVVREGLQLMKATLPATVEIRETIETTDSLVVADTAQLQQVLMNLCTNGAQAMDPQGGTLEVSLEHCHLSAADAARLHGLNPGPHVRLTVRDEGSGIPADSLEKMFDPFFTTKGEDGGTGLGLAVVHGIVQSHRAAIDVESTVGAGTRVSVYFPCHGHDQIARNHGGATLPEGVSGSILVVDDDPALVSLLERSLKRLGYRVEAYSVSSEALESFRAGPERFDLVITDQTMPGMTGTQLAEHLIEARPDLPIVLVSGMGAPTEQSVAEFSGALELLPKPFTTAELSAVLARVLHTADA